MERQNSLAQTDLERMTQLELENKELKEEIAHLVDSQIAYQKLVEEIRIFEERHKKSQLRFQTIFEKSQLGNKILAPDLSIIEVNEAFVSMLGYTNKNDLINRKILEFAHPDFIKHWHELQNTLWEKKIPTFSLDTCLIKKDKSVIWCRVTSILFEDEQRTLGYTIVEDINERKFLEEKSERLYQNQEIMMYMVAHDLKSPLHTIQTLSGLIRKNIEAHEQDEALLYLSMLEKTCVISDAIIDDLMLIGELESGKVEKQVVDVVDILRSVVEQVSPIAKKKEIQVIQEFTQTAVFAKVNREKLARVIENLLSNAIKFSNAGGYIKAFVKQEEFSLLLQVKDQGIGIPVAIQPTVFNKFTKAKRRGTQGENTTGLGLFISKRIVDIHYGKIWFESKQNEGTTFFIRLPLSD